ncbi:amidohydrolase family protein [Streptomyces monomycini]|uniref:amidohydrolase family protein n=1 Tax=Streptomyces monomycini TaxID=371720 RepID=UPI0009978A82|nr:amidohydrolase family protein [Streptomyces monomycini]
MTAPAAGPGQPPPAVRIDAHHHLWDLTRRPQPWMDGAWADPVRRTYTLDDLTPHLAAHGIDGTLLVQSSASAAETAELLALAARAPAVRGVVGWADLTDPGLPDLLAAMPPQLVGLRHQVQDEPDPDWLARPAVRRGLAAVADAGLVYDLLITRHHLPAASAVAHALPGLRLVLDHAAKPAIAVGAWQPWADDLAALARLPNTVCKLSGLVTEASWPTWRPVDITPYTRHVLDTFGPHRVLFGSDWPVCTLAAPYDVVVTLAGTSTAHLTPDERAAVFGGNAARVYGV